MVYAVSFSPDGSLLASGSHDSLILWRVVAPVSEPPSAPTLIKPSDGALVSTLPLQLQLSANDPDGNLLRFKVELLHNNKVVRTFDQTQDSSGWDKSFYRSGEGATLTISQLSPGTYEWRAYAFDGRTWGAVSETRSFTLSPQLAWTLLEPVDDTVQVPLFRWKLEQVGAGPENLQFRLEVSRDPQFQQQVLVFDQSVSREGWFKDSHAFGEIAACLPLYDFPFYTRFYWRVRFKRVGESRFSDPSPSQSFQLIKGFSVRMPPQIRVGRKERIPVTITNPSRLPTDFFLSFGLSLNTDEFVGRARLIDPNEQVVDEVVIGQGPLQCITPGLPQGTHTYTLEITVTPSRKATGQNQSTRIAPLLVFLGQAVVGAIVGYLIDTACEQAANLVLKGEFDFSDMDASSVTGAAKSVTEEIATQEIENRQVSYHIAQRLYRIGGEGLVQKFARKFGTKGIPGVSMMLTILDCAKKFLSEPEPEGFPIVRSWDPNMKMGILGREGFIQPTEESLPYRILFENKAEATAAAYQVIITDPLDEDLDLSSLTFTEVGLGERTFPLPSNPHTLSLDIPIHNNLVVQVRGSVDETTRTLTVTFTGIDPITGDINPDGFLPPNRTPPEGEGFVAFAIKMNPDLPSGTQIKNKATIVFDVEKPLDTNEITVTIDRDAPESKVLPLPERQPRTAFDVRWEARDEVSGVDTVQLWVNEERATGSRQVIIGERLFHLARRVAGSAQPQTRFQGKFGYRYRFYTRAIDVAGSAEAEPEQPDGETVVGQSPTLPAGLQMVSVPVQSEEPDPKTVFGFEGNKWARYDPTKKAYVFYDNDPEGFTKFAEPTRVPGRGYWVVLSGSTQPMVFGATPDEGEPFAIGLTAGWNQIGNPFLAPVRWDVAAIKVRRNGETKALREARQAGWVEDYAWGWDGSKYVLVYDNNLLPSTQGQLEGWRGYWVYAHAACELVLPSPWEQRSRSREQGVRGSGWSVGLQAVVNGSTGEAVIGTAIGTRGLAIGLPPEPPVGGSAVQVFVLQRGQPLAVDVRKEVGQRQEWDVVVQWGVGQGARSREQGVRSEVMLTWDGTGYVPKDVSLTLVDLATGTRRYMRTQTAYRFVPQPNETERRFKVIAELDNARPLQIVGLKATPLRGQGVVVGFTLTKPAQVRAEVLTLTGRKVAVIGETSVRMVGQQQLLWRGVNGDGAKMPNGAYLVRLTATDEEGRQVQGTTTVWLR